MKVDFDSPQVFKTCNNNLNNQHQGLRIVFKIEQGFCKKKQMSTGKHKHRFQCYAYGEEGNFAIKCLKKHEPEDKKKASASISIRLHVSLCARRRALSNCRVQLLDCGASYHMTCRKYLMKHYEVLTGEVELEDGRLKVKGELHLKCHMNVVVRMLN